MVNDYGRLATVSLAPAAGYERPANAPDLVHLDDPASFVFTDFRMVRPITTVAEQRIDAALEVMKSEGVRLLLVVDEADHVVGVVTAADIQGEKPIQLAEANRESRDAITVGAVMTPSEALEVLSYPALENARVGNVLETMRALERRHLVVADRGGRRVLGLFSASQIAKQLRLRLDAGLPIADSLAAIQREASTRRGDRALGEMWSRVVEGAPR